MAIKLLEKDIQKLIVGWLESKGCQVRKNHTTGIPDGKGGFRKNATKGKPDLTATIKPEGKLFDIEVKRPGNKASPEQLEFLEATKMAGGLAMVAFSLEEVQKAYFDFKLPANDQGNLPGKDA